MKPRAELFDKLKRIKILALDFDGTLTDGHVYTDQDGREMVRCSRKDALGLNQLKKLGIHIVIISTETNEVVEARCRKMRVDVYYDAESSGGKLVLLKRYAVGHGASQNEIVYVGDDTNDLECLEFAGVSATVADGHELCKEKADYITQRNGGDHAVREICDLILKAKAESIFPPF